MQNIIIVNYIMSFVIIFLFNTAKVNAQGCKIYNQEYKDIINHNITCKEKDKSSAFDVTS